MANNSANINARSGVESKPQSTQGQSAPPIQKPSPAATTSPAAEEVSGLATAPTPAASADQAPIPATQDVGPAKGEQPAAKENRSRWLNATYNNTLRNVQGKQWTETDNRTKKISWHFTEIGRTPQYVELKRKEVGSNGLVDYRVYVDHMDVKRKGKWGWVSSGHWTSE
jgi:hypothetical protein